MTVAKVGSNAQRNAKGCGLAIMWNDASYIMVMIMRFACQYRRGLEFL